MERSRPPAVAGSFYPAEAGELRGVLEDCFQSDPLGPRGSQAPFEALLGAMVPHAGYSYSGPCAAHLYARLNPATQRVVILGVNHRATGHKAALSPWEVWQTPLGQVTVDQELSESLQHRVGFMKADEHAHRREHSIEVQLPFLQRALANFSFVPILLSHISIKECAELGHAVAEACLSQDRPALILASSDLDHYRSPEETERLDQMALEPVLARQPEKLLRVVAQESITMCGVIPTAVTLYAVNAMGATHAQLLKHCHSGDAVPMREVVGYASVSFER